MRDRDSAQDGGRAIPQHGRLRVAFGPLECFSGRAGVASQCLSESCTEARLQLCDGLTLGHVEHEQGLGPSRLPSIKHVGHGGQSRQMAGSSCLV